jgi:hypothetical protein
VQDGAIDQKPLVVEGHTRNLDAVCRRAQIVLST